MSVSTVQYMNVTAYLHCKFCSKIRLDNVISQLPRSQSHLALTEHLTALTFDTVNQTAVWLLSLFKLNIFRSIDVITYWKPYLAHGVNGDCLAGVAGAVKNPIFSRLVVMICIKAAGI